MDDGKPFAVCRDVAELAAEMVSHRRHVARAEYHADLERLGGAITVNLVEHAHQAGISHGGEVVFQQPVEPAAGQVFRALVVSFCLVQARHDRRIDELPDQHDGDRPGNIGCAGLEPFCGRSRPGIRLRLPAHRHTQALQPQPGPLIDKVTPSAAAPSSSARERP